MPNSIDIKITPNSFGVGQMIIGPVYDEEINNLRTWFSYDQEVKLDSASFDDFREILSGIKFSSMR